MTADFRSGSCHVFLSICSMKELDQSMPERVTQFTYHQSSPCVNLYWKTTSPWFKYSPTTNSQVPRPSTLATIPHRYPLKCTHPTISQLLQLLQFRLQRSLLGFITSLSWNFPPNGLSHATIPFFGQVHQVLGHRTPPQKAVSTARAVSKRSPWPGVDGSRVLTSSRQARVVGYTRILPRLARFLVMPGWNSEVHNQGMQWVYTKITQF